MNILLTGAHGFVGKALHQKLINHSVCLISRGEIEDNKDKIFYKTISGSEDFTDCLDNIDLVIHTAARVHQMKDVSQNPLSDFMETNCHGTIKLAKHAAKAGVKRFIFISSLKVNGEETNSGARFRYDDKHNTNDPYGISKAEAENGLMNIAANSNLEIVIIRPPLVYGPGVKANFESLLKISQKNLPLPLGAINNKRSFVALDNLVDLINICIDHPNAANKVFLVSDDSDISTSDLLILMSNSFNKKSLLLNINPKVLKFIGKILGKQSIIDRLCDNFQVDIEYTKNTLNWKPPLSMFEGVKRCAKYIKNTD